MNIAVIGSGATAFGVLLKLKEKLGKSDIKITILSKDLNFMNKIFSDYVNDKKTKFALIGTGSRAMMFIEPIVTTFKETSELVALSDTNPTRLQYYNNLLKNDFGQSEVPTYNPEEFSKMIKDIIKNSNKNISQLKIKTNNDVFNQSNFLISMSNNMKIDSIKIRKFLYKNVYNHPKLIKKRANSENIILKLFEYFEKNFDQLPIDWLSRNKKQSKHRIICDYISGMTDRYASKLYRSLYE